MGEKMIRFPQFLSRPYQVLWWETDELVVIMLSYLCASNFGTLFAWNLTALLSWAFLFIIPWVYRYHKKQHPSGFLRHMLYFSGILIPKNYPSFFIQTFNE